MKQNKSCGDEKETAITARFITSYRYVWVRISLLSDNIAVLNPSNLLQKYQTEKSAYVPQIH